MNRLLSHVSYANVMASLALVVAMGGTSYAVAQLPKDSVTSKQVKNQSLRTKDFSAGDLAALRGPAGPAGAAGPAGPSGSPATLDPAVNELIPVAAFSLDSGGGLRPNLTFRAPVTGTPTVAHVAGSGVYDVTLPGLAFSSTGNGSVSCTQGSSGEGFVSAGSANDSVRIFTHNRNGVATDLPTACAVYYQP